MHDEMDARRAGRLALMQRAPPRRGRHGAHPGRGARRVPPILGALTLALVGIASVSLAVAGVGIMNVMLVSVSERRAEIGLLKALGARDRQVLAAFLAEAVMLSLAGGVAGLGGRRGAVAGVRALLPGLPGHAAGWAVAAALRVSLAVGVVFGVLPARRATRLDPVAALARR